MFFGWGLRPEYRGEAGRIFSGRQNGALHFQGSNFVPRGKGAGVIFYCFAAVLECAIKTVRLGGVGF